jgi:hypothetical protein
VTSSFKLALIWIATVAVAVFVQISHTDASYFDGAYHPAGNDSFYHARRILDTARSPADFYEFDPKIHAPEGSLVTWPWGYDYVMGRLTGVLAGLLPGVAPIAILAHLPVVAVVFSVSLILLIGLMLGLGYPYLLLAGLATALSPLTQLLHGVGNIDQHFAEYIAVLAALASGMAWLRRPHDTARAALTGMVLGVSPAIHSALFVLQVPLLLATLLLWLRGRFPPVRQVAWFTVALLFATVLILAPSEPVHRGHFEYFRLSWFQLYIALCTSAVVAFLSWTRPRPGTLLIGVVGSLVLAVPLLASVQHAGMFFAREIAMNRTIQETISVMEMLRGDGGVRAVVGDYSALVLLLPITLAYCLRGLLRDSAPERTLFFVACLLGVPLLLSQIRLNYFGSFALYLPLLTMFSDTQRGLPAAKNMLPVAAAVVFALAYWVPVTDRLFMRNLPANDLYYSFTRMALPALEEACRQDPGIVLAISNDGHYIRYHTECSVISNNFLVTPQHEEKALLTTRLLGMTPEELSRTEIPIKYVLARASGLVVSSPEGRNFPATREMAQYVTPPLFDELLWSDVDELPVGWRSLQEWRMPGEDNFVFMRLLKGPPEPMPHPP